MDHSLVTAAFLGVIEGLTEFIPVSSTAHVLLAEHLLGIYQSGKAFEVMIQLGAVLAVLTVYGAKLWQLFSSAPHDRQAQRFVLAVSVAFFPAAIIGVLAHGFIKSVLFATPDLIALMLVSGGIVLLFVDRLAIKPKYERAEDVPVSTAFKIGLIQCLAMIPGVSRSGATIVGALLLGVGKRGAAEFSFFLSMPTMAGAFIYEFWKGRAAIDGAAAGDIAVGFIMAFIVGLFVVRGLLEYVSRYGYALFGWWRIIVGGVALLVLNWPF